MRLTILARSALIAIVTTAYAVAFVRQVLLGPRLPIHRPVRRTA